MGRDKVLGLSLAILVIGFAAAFCFRNEQFVESGLKLARGKILDEQIAQRPGPKPYTQDTKLEHDKPSLPTVTLNGIQSCEPFSDIETAQAADRDKTQAPRDKTKTQGEKTQQIAEGGTHRGSSRPPAEITSPSPGGLTAADTESATIDTDRAAPEINTANNAAPTVFPAAENPVPQKQDAENPIAEKPAAPSQLLTSKAPPADEMPIAERESPSSGASASEAVVRPNAPPGGRSELLVQHNVVWQSPASPRDAVISPRNPAGNSARKTARNTGRSLTAIDPAPDNSGSDDPHRYACTRDNPTRDVPGIGDPGTDNSGPDNSHLDKSANDGMSRDNFPEENSRGENWRREQVPRYNPAVLDPAHDDPGAARPDASTATIHRVRRGDTLTKIALHYLGDSSRYREIFEANRDQLRTPNDRLKIGMALRIPDNPVRPVRSGTSIAHRKPSANRYGRAASGASHAPKVPIRNVARIREKPPGTPSETGKNDSGNMERTNTEKTPAAPPADESMNSNPRPANRFIPVEKAPFLPGGKKQTDQPPAENKDSPPDGMSHYRFFSRPEPVRIVGDREDATIR